MKKVGWSSILVATLVLVFGVAAEAQQPTKVPRIAYSQPAPAPRKLPGLKYLDKVCASLDT